MAAPCSGICSLEQQFSYTENDFHWPSGYGNRDKVQHELTISKVKLCKQDTVHNSSYVQLDRACIEFSVADFLV